MSHATLEKQLEAALRRVLNSKVIQFAPFASYSEAILEAQELIKQIDDGTLKRDDLHKAAVRLAARCNRLTAEHRHFGTIGKTMGNKQMVALYDAQVEVERLTGSLKIGSKADAH